MTQLTAIAGAIIITASVLVGCAAASDDRRREQRREIRRDPAGWFARLTKDVPRG